MEATLGVVDLDLGALKDKPKISLHAIMESIGPSTMRVMTDLGGVEIVVLIDTGSTQFLGLRGFTQNLFAYG